MSNNKPLIHDRIVELGAEASAEQAAAWLLLAVQAVESSVVSCTVFEHEETGIQHGMVVVVNDASTVYVETEPVGDIDEMKMEAAWNLVLRSGDGLVELLEPGVRILGSAEFITLVESYTKEQIAVREEYVQ